MTPTGPVSDAGISAMQAIMSRPRETMIGMDFDGTLAPIIEDPEHAYADSAAVNALAELGPLVGSIVVITGRPAQTAVRLGRFAGRPGLESMVVLGQYGVERWDAASGDFSVPPDPEEITRVAEELPSVLASLGLEGVRIEHKGRAIGNPHPPTRRPSRGVRPVAVAVDRARPAVFAADRARQHAQPARRAGHARTVRGRRAHGHARRGLREPRARRADDRRRVRRRRARHGR